MAPLTRSLALVAALTFPVVATAQVRGLPLVNSGIRNGGSLAADIGFGNDAAGTGTTLGTGTLVIRTGTTERRFRVQGGFLQVVKNRVRVLAESVQGAP